jgi:hypothetical protein
MEEVFYAVGDLVGHTVGHVAHADEEALKLS